MKAIVLESYGDESSLIYREVKDLRPKPGQALVKVKATSINPIDWKIASGSIQVRPVVGLFHPKKDKILGGDVAGIIEEINISENNKEENKFKVGDRVYGLKFALVGGGYAQYICMDIKDLAIIPKKMKFKEAAGIPLAGITALQALKKEGKIKIGDQVLINGASGGVGTFAVQYAKALGAKVTAVCSEKNSRLVKSLGANVIIDYKKQNFIEHAVENNIKYNIVFDVVSNSSFSKCSKIMAFSSSYINTNFSTDVISRMLIGNIFSKKKAFMNVVGSSRRDLEYSNKLFEEGRLKTIIDRTWKLEEVPKAHAYNKLGRTVGKNIILV